MNKKHVELLRNGSGYVDHTAYDAIMTLEEEEAAKKRLIKTIKYICDLAGFDINSRIILENRRSGRVWK